MGKLTAKQALFVREYPVDLNATAAARRAGYSEKAARQIGMENLTKPAIQEALQEVMGRRAKRVQVRSDDVIRELMRLGFANMLDYIKVQSDGSAYVDLSTVNRDQAAAITEVYAEVVMEGSGEDKIPVRKVRIKLADKKGPLELLGKHLRLFVDKIEVGADPTDPLVKAIARAYSVKRALPAPVPEN
jgi:phage terminase small subunit